MLTDDKLTVECVIKHNALSWKAMALASDFKVNLKLGIKKNINGYDLFVILKSLIGFKMQNRLKTWVPTELEKMFIHE